MRTPPHVDVQRGSMIPEFLELFLQINHIHQLNTGLIYRVVVVIYKEVCSSIKIPVNHILLLIC